MPHDDAILPCPYYELLRGKVIQVQNSIFSAHVISGKSIYRKFLIVAASPIKAAPQTFQKFTTF